MPESTTTDVRPAEKRRISHPVQPDKRTSRLALPSVDQIGEPSLDAPPVYRRFLAGGGQTLQLQRGSLLTLLFLGTLCLGIRRLITMPQGAGANLVFLSNAAGALICALVLALMISRWLGNRLGMLTGLAWLGSTALLGSHIDTWSATLFCSAIGLYALANVPGRLPTVGHRAIAWAFFGIISLALLILNPTIVMAILIACFAAMLITQNTQSVRFFLEPVGLGIFAATILGRWLVVPFVLNGHEIITPGLGEWLSSWSTHETVISTSSMIAVALGGLPLAIVGMVMGLRQGYHCSPFGKLLSCWILGPSALCAVGAISCIRALAIILPGVCVLFATGLMLSSNWFGLSHDLDSK